MANSRTEGMDLSTQILLIVGIMALLIILWMTLGHYIVNTAVLIAISLIRASNFLYELLPRFQVTDALFIFFVEEMFVKNTDIVIEQIQNYQSSRPTLSSAKNVFYIIGYFLRLPIALIAIWGSYLAYKQSKPSQLKRKFDIFSLSKYSQAYFPQIRPAIMANLIKTSFDEGKYRQEVGPIRFAVLANAVKYISEDGEEYNVEFGKKLKFNEGRQVLQIIDSYDIDEGLPIIHGRCKLDSVKIRKLFRNQITHLGRWKSPDDLPPQIKALYAVFLLMIKGGEENKEKAFTMLDHFSSTFKATKEWAKNNTFDMNGVDEVIELYGDQVAVKKIHKKNTFSITVLYALYNRATYRRSKLPPSRFLWLKEVDIKTWYALSHNLSPGAWTEAAGSRGMWLTEKKLNKRANYPFTDNALLGYVKYLTSEGWLIEQPTDMQEVTL